MALEDFTTYTLGGADAANAITVNSATKVTFNSNDEASAWLVKDFGAGFFNSNQDIEIQFEVTLITASGFAFFATMTPQPGTRTLINSGNFSGGYIYGRSLSQMLAVGGSEQYDSAGNAGFSEKYYATLKQAAGTNLWTMDYFEDAQRTSLWSNASITASGPMADLRYLQAVHTQGDGGAWASGQIIEIENMEVISPSGVQPPAVKPNPLLLGQDF